MITRAKALDDLFAFLKAQDVSFCIVGPSQGLPDSIESDVDIVVSPDDAKRFQNLLLAFCQAHHLSLIQCLQHNPCACYYVLGWSQHHDEPQFLHPDVCDDFVLRQRVFLPGKRLLSNAQPALDAAGNTKSFQVPQPHLSFIYYLLKRVAKQSLPKDACDYLHQTFQADPRLAESMLAEFWPQPEARQLAEAARTDHWDSVQSQLPRLFRKMRSPYPTSIQLPLREWGRRIKRVLRPTGVFVVILGADGSGKSSVIQGVLSSMAPAFRHTMYCHLRPRWLDRSSRNEGQEGPVIPYTKPNRGFFTSLCKLGYLWLDYTLGFFRKIYPRLICSTLVVFDRYAYDLLADPRRLLYGGPAKLVQWLVQSIPQPDLVILLDAPAECLQSRKQEVSLEESVRQREAYCQLVRTLPNGFVISADQPLEHVVADVNQVLMAWMAQRVKARG